MKCFRIVAGIESLVEDVILFRFKIYFLIFSILIVSKLNSLAFISGKNKKKKDECHIQKQCCLSLKC